MLAFGGRDGDVTCVPLTLIAVRRLQSMDRIRSRLEPCEASRRAAAQKQCQRRRIWSSGSVRLCDEE